MIQAVVNRMSVNSFLLKGWSVVLISALFALAAGDSQALFVYIAYFPAIAFWMLDAYFLRQERLLRNGIVAVQIHHLQDKDGNTDPAGAIPSKIESNGYEAYKYVDHEKLGKWIEDAAKAAGK